MKRKATIALSLALALSAAPRWAGSPSSAVAAENGPARSGLVAAGGLVEPASEARQLSATVIGRIVKFNADEGDRVAAGQVIAEIENAELKAQLAAAQAELAARESELERLNTGAREQELNQAKAEVKEAEAAAQLARVSFDRRRELVSKQVASAETIDQARMNRDVTEARRALMSERLSLLAAPPRAEDVAIAEARVGVARARIAEITAQIEKTIIRSPIDGIVLKVFRRMGETVTNLPPSPIATVGEIDHLRVRADVDETDVGRIAPGQTAWVTADAFKNKKFRGTVARIGMQLGRKNFRRENPEERLDTKVLEVLIDLDEARLPIGLPVDVIFEAPRPARTASNPSD
jgi:HlyD family secretion protein